MAAERPILVLQMQRMGDLILSFPLFLWLAREHPGHPIWVVAEEAFFAPLMGVSPRVTYFPWSGADILLREKFRLVLNVSVQERAARLAGRLDAEQKLGLVIEANGVRRVLGDWQLYRAGLVENNRHNRFHWADLNALDVIPAARIRSTAFDAPRRLSPEASKVGVFLGASEAAKRPGVELWAALLRDLLERGLLPVLLGGANEAGLANEVLRAFGGSVLNLCGKLALNEFAAIGQSLKLLVTPDTGPMHLAAWTGLATLNLSMGNVNPWETGPYQPGHHVLRASVSCANGCWTCRRPRLSCHEPFAPGRIGFLCARIAAGDAPDKLGRLSLPGLSLFLTGRGEEGLFRLESLGGRPPASERLLGRFWHGFFGWRFRLFGEDRPRAAFRDLRAAQPRTAEALVRRLPALGRQLKLGLSRGRVLDRDFWGRSPPLLKPFTGQIQLFLQNRDFEPKAWSEALELFEKLSHLCAP